MSGGGGWEAGESRCPALMPVAWWLAPGALRVLAWAPCQSESLGKVAGDQNEGQLANS